jgi:hypothetical protein
MESTAFFMTGDGHARVYVTTDSLQRTDDQQKITAVIQISMSRLLHEIEVGKRVFISLER